MQESSNGKAAPSIDWAGAEASAEFQELVRSKRRFVVPATLGFLAWYFGFIVLAGYAPGFMGETFLVDGLTVGYALALTQFAMVWGLGILYLRRAERVFDPLAERVVARALAPAHAEPALVASASGPERVEEVKLS